MMKESTQRRLAPKRPSTDYHYAHHYAWAEANPIVGVARAPP